MERVGLRPQGALTAPGLAELATGTGPFLSLYLTTDAELDNASQRSAQRWKSLRAELTRRGVPEKTLAVVDPLVAEAHLHGRCLGVIAPAEGPCSRRVLADAAAR